MLSYGHAAAWGNDALFVRDFMFTGQGNGLHLDRQKFDTALLEEASNVGVAVFQPAEIINIEHDDDWFLDIRTAEAEIAITSHYLIDCTGKNALIVKIKKRPVHKEDSLIALYAYYNLTEDLVLEQQTILETTEDGWYYLSPLPNKKVAIAFITDADILKALNLNDPDAWLSAGLATNHISRILTKLQQPEAFRHYAIHSRIASLPYNENWTAAGDAAACFDPISSMGIGHAINSGIQSARVAEAFFNGDYRMARNYSQFLFRHFENYLNMRHRFYGIEKRWEASPFWKRRTKLTVNA
jgi:flavin-dependent dehydrogenase